MGSAAEVDEAVALRIEAHYVAFGAVDVVGLVFVASHSLEGFGSGHFDPLEGGVGLYDLGHCRFDPLEVLGPDGLVEVDIVVEAIGDVWAVDQLGVGPEPADRLSHDVCAAMTHDLQAFVVP